MTSIDPPSRRWRPSHLGALFAFSRRWTVEIQGPFVGFSHPRRSLRIPFARILHIAIEPGRFWSKIVIATADDRLRLGGLPRTTAWELFQVLRRASCSARLQTLADPASLFFKWAKRIESVWGLSHWVRSDETQALWEGRPGASAIGFDLHDLTRDLEAHPDLRSDLDATLSHALSLTRERLEEDVAARNERFLERESREYASFFESVEKSPLNREQVRACICFESRVLTIAAAGSGKTATMVAKAGYATMRGLARPDEILMLAFNADAARELSRRVTARLGPLGIDAERITSATFHKLGLEIIGKATGRKPRVAPWLENGQDLDTIDEIMTELSASDPAFRAKLGLFRWVLSRDLSPFKEDPQPDAWDSSENRAGFRTLRGETVKSQEERLLADWLFYNGVAYEYERSYEFDTTSPQFGQYRPDFYYPDVQLYHEHFALDESGQPPERFGKRYLDGVEWKRSIHRERGTRLFETTSFGLREGNDLERLQAELEAQGIQLRPDPERPVQGRTPPSNLELARKFRVFLSHAKNNRMTVDDLRLRVARSTGVALRIRQTAFLSLYERIAAEWDRRLRDGELVDFEDMLNRATDLVERGAWKSPFRLVMVDEFQDVSRSRADFVKALVKDEGRFLFAVGDDWQAINRFAGADLSIMTRFDAIFGAARELFLQETFRSPQVLCDVASEFILENRSQIRKAVVSSQPVFGEPVQVYLCDESSREALIEKHLQILHDKVGGPQHPARPDGTVSVLLLGRYNKDLPLRLRQWRDGFGDRLRIEFLTIHSSKGLEADYVILVRMSSGNLPFPSTLEDDPILLLAMPDADTHLFAEERRLFYVALTRARRMVVIYCDARSPSPFIAELQTASRVSFVGERRKLCPSCKMGALVRRDGPFSAFWGCTRYPLCRYTRQIEEIPASI
ncbi:MAG: UvrD-helicase domain-containing protein [Myxococcota bacterium]